MNLDVPFEIKRDAILSPSIRLDLSTVKLPNGSAENGGKNRPGTQTANLSRAIMAFTPNDPQGLAYLETYPKCAADLHSPMLRCRLGGTLTPPQCV